MFRQKEKIQGNHTRKRALFKVKKIKNEVVASTRIRKYDVKKALNWETQRQTISPGVLLGMTVFLNLSRLQDGVQTETARPHSIFEH